jgi:glycosyltransferase involved in cell wall biosynthesis
VRIALVGPAHPYKGGGARHTTELAHQLAAAGHDVVIESWRAQYPAWLYPGQQLLDVPEGEPYPRTRRRLAWYRPDGWLAEGRRLASADLVVFALLTPLQVPAYLTILAALRRASDPLQPLLPRRPRTVVICHNVLPHERRLGDIALTRALLSRVDTVLVHSPAQAIQARDLAPAASVVTAQMPPHLPCSLGGDERRPLGGDDPPQTPPAHGGATRPPIPPGPGFTRLVEFEAERARDWYATGWKLLPLLDRRSAACTGAMAGIYRRLLERIAAEPAAVLRGRTSLSGQEKATVALKALAGRFG